MVIAFARFLGEPAGWPLSELEDPPRVAIEEQVSGLGVETKLVEIGEGSAG